MCVLSAVTGACTRFDRSAHDVVLMEYRLTRDLPIGAIMSLRCCASRTKRESDAGA